MIFYLVNQSLSIAIELTTLIEVWFRSTANYSNPIICGCLAHDHASIFKLKKVTHKWISVGWLSMWDKRLHVKVYGKKSY